MRRENSLARLLRAISGKTQEQFAADTGVDPSLIAWFELGRVVPGREHLEAMARSAGIGLADAEEVLRLIETRCRPRRRWGRGPGQLFDQLAEGVRADAEAVYQRLLTLPLPDRTPKAEDRQGAEELFARVECLDAEVRRAVIGVVEEFQTWALCERCCHASEREASRDLAAAAAWAQLGQEIAERILGPEAWRHRIQGYALAHVANLVRVSGELEAAEIRFEQAKRLWHAGSDPGGLLDPGRLLDLEASLRRGQRRFAEALALLDEAEAVGRCPERALIKKGFTLEVMGEHERAVEVLQRCAPLVDRRTDLLLWYNQRFNLAVNFCHLGRCAEAADLMAEVREVAAGLGDEIFLIRVTWLEGRIAAGLGRPVEARRLLAEARRGFEQRNLSYDVALALLEEAVLLLAEGESAEVKILAQELTEVFRSKGVHREALAALRLFHAAAEREQATAELARRLLRYLFRAQHDPQLRFAG